jgi:hypothetical protein
MQQSDIVHEPGESYVRYRFPAEGKHKGAPAVCMYIWRRLAEILDEAFLLVFYSHGFSFRSPCL